MKLLLSILFLYSMSGCSLLMPFFSLRKTPNHIDTNHNGQVEYAEFLKSSSAQEGNPHEVKTNITRDRYLKQKFSHADSDKDGKVSIEEYMIHLVSR